MKHIIIAVGISVAVFTLLFGLQKYTTHQAQVRTAKFVRDHYCLLYQSVPEQKTWVASRGGFGTYPAHKDYLCPNQDNDRIYVGFIISIDDTAVQP